MPYKPEDTRHLLTDLAIHSVHRELRPVFVVTERETVKPNGRDVVWDFELRDGKENLAQAVIMRLLTPRGELGALGHADYGARVHELIGRENTPTTRNQLKLFILEALKLEPRIEKVLQLKVQTSPGTKSTVDVWLQVKAVAFATPVEIGPFAIELAV
jgi:phage baseplate assembly protein W